MIHYHCITSQIPKTSSEHISNTTGILPALTQIPILSPKNSVTHSEQNLTESLLNPTPSSKINHLGNKQTTVILQIATILNTVVPQLKPNHLAQLQRVGNKPVPLQRVETMQKTTTTALPDLEPEKFQRVGTKNNITIKTVHSSRKPLQKLPHIISADTEIMPPATHPYYGKPIQVPLVHKYNTSSRRLQVHNLVYNHVTTITPPRKIPTQTYPSIKLRQTGEDW